MPKVIEIKPHANELDPKFQYLVEAPERDPDGNPAIIRYSRKTKEQYVQSEIEGQGDRMESLLSKRSLGRRAQGREEGENVGLTTSRLFARLTR